MNTTTVIIVIAGFAVLGLVAWVWRRRRGGGTFWDYQRNPPSEDPLETMRRDIGQLVTRTSGSEAEVRRLVDYYVFEAKSENDAWIERRAIEKLDAETHPRALEILRDTSTHATLVTEVREGEGLPEVAMSRLCAIFEGPSGPPAEAIDLLGPFLVSESEAVRKCVGLVLGSSGLPQALPHVGRALRDAQEYVRSHTLIGISRAVKARRVDPAALAGYFALVAGMLPGDGTDEVSNHTADAAELMLELDWRHGIQRLLEPDLFSAGYARVDAVLKALVRASVDVPRLPLLAILDELGRKDGNHRKRRVMEYGLGLLGRHRVAEDLPRLEGTLESLDERVVRGAVAGLRAWHRHAELVRDPEEVLAARGWDELTDVERHLSAVRWLNAEVDNGGFAQYYFNPGGDQWREALAGLAAIGAVRRQAVMAATIAKFGEAGPATDLKTRRSQLARVVRRQEDPFNEQDEAWYDAKAESLERLLFRYDLANTAGREKLADAEPG